MPVPMAIPFFRLLAFAGFLLCLPWQVLRAHEAQGSIPQNPGAQLGAALAVHYFDVRQPWPAPHLGGVLGTGQVPEDQRRGHLEHAAATLGVRLHARAGFALGVGWHGSDAAHVENAWLALRPAAHSPWMLGAGRSRVPAGHSIETAGHFDTLASMPLAKRALFGGDWIEDGANLTWQPQHAGTAAVERVDFGLWHARRFPGAENAAWSPVLRLRLRPHATLALDSFAARIRVRARGTRTLRPGMGDAGHSHAAPDCRSSLREVSCFDGRAALGGIGMQWQSPLSALQLHGAALWRNENGTLYGQSSHAAYRGRTRGLWLQGQWQAAPTWHVALRQEWLRADQRLRGNGAALLARDAGLLPNRPASRSSAALIWHARAHMHLSLEAGSEKTGAKQQRFAGLRLLWQPAPWHGAVP